MHDAVCVIVVHVFLDDSAGIQKGNGESFHQLAHHSCCKAGLECILSGASVC